MKNKNSRYHKQLELDRIEACMRLQRMQQIPSGDPVHTQSRQQLQLKLERIESAMARMASDVFGTCQSCKQPIEPERLAAMPYVELCMPCQRQLERKTIGTHRYYQFSHR